MSNVMSYFKSTVERKIREMKMIMKKLISNLLIHNFRNKYVQTKLWGKTALLIDDDFYISNRNPFIVIVTSTIAKAYKGNISLSMAFPFYYYFYYFWGGGWLASSQSD